MDTVFPPDSPLYLTAALAWAVVNYGLLPLLLPWSIRRWLNVPAMLLHEFAHWFLACAMLGFPKVSFRQGVDEDGCPTVAHVKWKWNLFGWIGNALICIAPFVAGLGLAWYIANQQFTQEQPFWHAVGWLALFCVAIESAGMISNSDFKGLGWPGRIVFLYVVFQCLLVGVSTLVVWGGELAWPLVEADVLLWLTETGQPWFEENVRPVLDRFAGSD